MGLSTLSLLQNMPIQWGVALGIEIIVLVGPRLFVDQAIRRLPALANCSDTEVDDLAVILIHLTQWLALLALAVHVGTLALILPADINSLISSVVAIALLTQLVICESVFPTKTLYLPLESGSTEMPTASDAEDIGTDIKGEG